MSTPGKTPNMTHPSHPRIPHIPRIPPQAKIFSPSGSPLMRKSSSDNRFSFDVDVDRWVGRLGGWEVRRFGGWRLEVGVSWVLSCLPASAFTSYALDLTLHSALRSHLLTRSLAPSLPRSLSFPHSFTHFSLPHSLSFDVDSDGNVCTPKRSKHELQKGSPRLAKGAPVWSPRSPIGTATSTRSFSPC